jgi:hypothetical protein
MLTSPPPPFLLTSLDIFFLPKLGSALSVGPPLLPLFAQLGIGEEYIAMSKYARYHEVVNESGESMLSLDYVVGQA